MEQRTKLYWVSAILVIIIALVAFFVFKGHKKAPSKGGTVTAPAGQIVKGFPSDLVFPKAQVDQSTYIPVNSNAGSYQTNFAINSIDRDTLGYYVNYFLKNSYTIQNYQLNATNGVVYAVNKTTGVTVNVSAYLDKTGKKILTVTYYVQK